MKRISTLIFAAVSVSFTVHAQLLTWTPDFAKDNDNITITMDAAKGNQGLNNYATTSDVYVHTGVITSSSTTTTDWRYSKFTWATTPVAAQATYLGNNKWQYTITNIRVFYGVPAGETIQKIAILFRNGAGTAVQRNADASDMYIPVYDNTVATRFTVPLFQPTYTSIPEPISKQVGDNIALTAVASKPSTMKLFLNGTEIQSATAATTISANPTLTTAGSQTIRVDAIDGATTKFQSFSFFVATAPNVAALPAGVRDGINYLPGNTSVTLVLNAPGKTRVSVIGEFPGSNWAEQTAYVMNKTPDGNYWWLQINGLTPGLEYAFQYLVDGSLKVGEPYAEKILDPSNDGFITASTFPSLKPYPTGLTSGIVSVLQTNPPGYSWAINNFSRPDKRNLVIYEMLLRDFLAAHDWKTLKDTLSYFKTLGINAIQLMPFNEFEGNESWGYNPDYFLAPDKYYGPKNTLKEFIDACHVQGIAVIMDIALNHTTGLNPLAALYWNSATNQPAANYPWLNVTATHPYNVFNDFNHESLRTRYFSSRVIEHWLQEYKLDGFRFDLSKGFTQNTNCGGSTSNESCFAQYDASRVAIWKRYYDTTQLKSPGSYAILEHFAANNEEIELSDYGMMLWGNANYNFSEAAMGWVATSNFESFLHTARGWNKPHLIGYMESHDEERMMYRNLQFGNTSNSSHNVRDLNTALRRVELCAGFFLTAPGPKMIWQFGELGYDFSINRCTDGSISNDCRLSNKPIRWDYKNIIQRKRLYDVFSSLNKLRFHPWYKDVFIANNINLTRSLSGAFKSMTIRSATDSSMLCVVGNFDVTAQTGSFSFPVAGTWYDYLNASTFTATGGAQNMTLQPGEFHVYLNRNLVNAVTTPVTNNNTPGNQLLAAVYPNPAQSSSVLDIDIPQTGKLQVDLLNNLGQKVATIFSGNLPRGKHRMPLSDKINNLPAGTYLLSIQSANKATPVKLVIQ
ncbi:MAG: T9SS type A sorting domain-containing protein [Chitinophagaceae bacterium]|nr:T9SS type A sorting domain-containing protein [Chitinophagaceae bacterium]